jgi:hypothetical protein
MFHYLAGHHLYIVAGTGEGGREMLAIPMRRERLVKVLAAASEARASRLGFFHGGLASTAGRMYAPSCTHVLRTSNQTGNISHMIQMIHFHNSGAGIVFLRAAHVSGRESSTPGRKATLRYFS